MSPYGLRRHRRWPEDDPKLSRTRETREAEREIAAHLVPDDSDSCLPALCPCGDAWCAGEA